MATGGTIPSNRTQTVTFYNTSGVVEKDKNIYYVPRFSKTSATAGQPVSYAYLNAFGVVCPPSSSYTAINVSQWTPQDRTLVVKGNIDDFRVVTDEGACLNYFIITRTVSKTISGVVSSKTYYYGFFITEVVQAGGGSVRITAEPDDFTNVFYLHNNHSLSALDISGDYEPFNEKMTNNYVARQHYNRVLSGYYESVYECLFDPDDTFNFIVGRTYNISQAGYPEPTDYGNFKLLSVGAVPEGVILKFKDTNTSRKTVTVPAVRFITIMDTRHPNPSIQGEVKSWTKDEEESIIAYNPANMKIFMNQEQTFKFKYQYRDDKYPISPEGPFTLEEREIIENTDEIEDLPEDLLRKIVLASLHYLVVETKSTEVCSIYKYTNETVTPSTTTTRPLAMGELITPSIYRPNPVICYPFIHSPEVFRKYNLENRTDVYGQLHGNKDAIHYNLSYNNSLVTRIIERLNSEGIADYIYAVYVSNDVLVPSSVYTVSLSYSSSLSKYVIDVKFDLIYPNDYDSKKLVQGVGCYIAGIKVSMTEDLPNNYINRTLQITQNTLYSFSCAGMLVSGYENRQFHIELPILGSIPSNIKTTYYDPVLECEPYKFYSISTYGNYELVFNKNRYYQNGYLDVNYYISINSGIKVSFVPLYEVDEVRTPYYNEALTFTLASSLPLVSDSYSSYYNQNQAQMKNQFAVNEKNIKYDLAQHFFLSGPASVGKSAGKSGWVGAIIETANQFTQMLNEAIDYVQNKEVLEMNQKSKLADVGNAPDTLKQAGSDVLYDMKTKETFIFLNHYTIDDLSYNSSAKILERYGYQANLFDNLHVVDRVGWNFIQLVSFDWRPTVNIMVSQEEKIKQIFLNGVTLLHDKSFLTSGHNYETIIE